VLLLRDWAFPVYILASYWLPAQFVSSIDERAEAALRSFDRRWAGRLIDAASRAPRGLTELAELAYAFCYPLIPGGFAVLVLGGFEAQADRYWTALMGAAGLSYGALPWMPTRPPRAVETAPVLPASGVRRLNLLVLGHASVQLNTFPSGHVATAVAAALAVGSSMPVTGVALGGLAAAIAVACVVRRYHYAADALAGVLVGCVAFAFSRMA
jgi:membrane-associated phospholipid phosphatase